MFDVCVCVCDSFMSRCTYLPYVLCAVLHCGCGAPGMAEARCAPQRKACGGGGVEDILTMRMSLAHCLSAYLKKSLQVTLRDRPEGHYSHTPQSLEPIKCDPHMPPALLPQDVESENTAEWQSFDLTGYATELVTLMSLEIKGTGSGAPGFAMLDANIMGTQTENPTDTVYVSANRGGNGRKTT